MTDRIVLDFNDYLDRVRGCWLGKSIGGTLGGIHEGKEYVLGLDFYDPVPTEQEPNDDLDIQVVWLRMLEETGLPPRLATLGEWWLKCLTSWPPNEYGFCTRNLNRGLRPPISGCFENYYVDEMGSPIRSEIWACLAPGDPGLAAWLAWHDSMLDHSGGEGMHGEMFWAAVESAAFVERDVHKLLRIGLNMIPVHSQISRAVREAIWCHGNGLAWAEARERIRRAFVFGAGAPGLRSGNGPRACHAAVNHGFTVMGWLYGKGFGDSLCKAVNCGFDTDCTGATLGALLGILGGADAIPARWLEPVGQRVILHHFTQLEGAPETINDLTERTAKLARQTPAALPADFVFGEKTELPADLESLLVRNDRALLARDRDIHSAVEDRNNLAVTFHYGGEPVLHPGLARTVGVSLEFDGSSVKGEIELQAPKGWSVEPTGALFDQQRFILRAAEVPNRNTLTVTARAAGKETRAEFAILGPGEAKGYPAGTNVPRCRKCYAWEGACACDRRPVKKKEA